jgi:hypothetical protein
MAKQRERSISVWVIFVAGLLAGAAGSVVWRQLRSDVPAGADGRDGASVASRRADTAPAEAPGPALAKACSAVGAELARRLGEGGTMRIEPPFVVAGNLPADRLAGYLRWSIHRPAKAMWACYFDARPTRPITVLLLRDEASYRDTARRLMGDTGVAHFGYYKPSRRTLVMNISTGTGTLVHELTHALIAYDFPRVPDWFNEGLASLHEQCRVEDARIVGLVNWRLPGLQRAIREGTLRPLGELIAARDFYRNQVGRNYAQARYLCLYLQRQGKLIELYRRLRAAYGSATSPDPATDVRILESVSGRSMEQLDADLRAWAMELRLVG